MDNLNPNIWGKHGWKFMHYVTLSYPQLPTITDKKNMVDFFFSVGKILPCESCRINFGDHQKDDPLTSTVLKNKTNLVIWLMNIHNKVNKLHGKPQYTLEQLYIEYGVSSTSTITDDGIDSKSGTFFIILCTIFIVLIGFIFIKYKKSENDIFINMSNNQLTFMAIFLVFIGLSLLVLLK